MISWFVGMSGLLWMLSGGADAGSMGQLNNPAARPGQTRPIGGVQLDLEPRRAQVFVMARMRESSTTSEGTIATWRFLPARTSLRSSRRDTCL